MTTRLSLDQIEVQSPCKIDWSKMSGSEMHRYCDHCHLHVHDLSTLTQDEAQKLICSQAGHLCVRFARLPDGRVMTADRIPTLSYRTAPGKAAILWSILRTAAFAEDWPQWRGANRDGKVAGFPPPATWPKQLAEKWKVTVGAGDATPALVGDKLFVFTRQDADEVLTCMNI